MFIEDPRFPDRVAFGFRGGPRFKTMITAVSSGSEKRNAQWSRTRGEWTIDHQIKDQTLTDALIAFFYVANGMANGFRFKDWSDFTAVAASTGHITLISGSTYQLYKRYSFGSYTFDRLINKPISGVAFTGGGVYTLDTATGIVTKVSGSAPTGWTGEFDVPVRFGSDDLDIEGVEGGDALFSWSNVQLIETRDIT